MNSINIQFDKGFVIVQKNIGGKREIPKYFNLATTRPKEVLHKVDQVLLKVWELSEMPQEEIKVGGTE